jgi:DNA-binding ferritin-like protein (Dps family)
MERGRSMEIEWDKADSVQARSTSQERPVSRSNSSHKILSAQKRKDLIRKYSKFFISRHTGQKMTLHDASWILNTFSRMVCDDMYKNWSENKIINKVSEWCCTTAKTVKKLIDSEGVYIDRRERELEENFQIKDNVKDIIEKEIRICSTKGFPCTAKYLQDIFHEQGALICRRTVQRFLKKWDISYGKIKAQENHKERFDVLQRFKTNMERLEQNQNASNSCDHKKCKCILKKQLVYLDESYINQNHVTQFSYSLPDCKFNKPSGKGPRVVMAAAITEDGWLGIEPYELNDINKRLQKLQRDDTHCFKSIKYWVAKSGKGDYHKNFNQDVFRQYFEENILDHLTQPSIIILDNAPYHRLYEEGTFLPRKAKKKELREWLDNEGYVYDEKALKGELLSLVEENCPPPANHIEVLAETHGRENFGIPHELLYLPQYHPEINPIEMAWSQVKGYASYSPTYNLNRLKTEVLPQAFSVITPEKAKDLFAHVKKVERSLFEKYFDFKGFLTGKQYDEFAEDYEEEDSDEEYIDLD